MQQRYDIRSVWTSIIFRKKKYIFKKKKAVIHTQRALQFSLLD